MQEIEWKLLLQYISAGKCTPIIGPEACYRSIPTNKTVANNWAEEYNYPFKDTDNLAHVAQFIGVQHNNPMLPKELLSLRYQELHTELAEKDFKEKVEPHGILAKLPLPVYVTTNFDDCMYLALKGQNKTPQWDLCKWNQSMAGLKTNLEAGFTPSMVHPLIFYLYGRYTNTQSLVLTEDDYIKFLINTSKEDYRLPSTIKEKLAVSSLVFVGFNYTDWNFRIFINLLNRVQNNRLTSVTVVIPPEDLKQGDENGKKEEAKTYLEKYFKENNNLKFSVYWGNTEDFMAELNTRCLDQNLYEKFAAKIAAATKPSLDKRKLRDGLVRAFSVEELNSLCLDVEEMLREKGIELYVRLEAVGGTSKEGKIVNLIEFLDNRGHLQVLEAAVLAKRPNLL
jgi:hypothetical protein